MPLELDLMNNDRLDLDHMLAFKTKNFGHQFPVFDISVFPDKEAPMKIDVIDNKIELFSEKFHAHIYLQMCYLRKGSCIHYMENYVSEFKKGDLIIIPPHIYHNFGEVSSEVEMIQCEFMPSFINDNFQNLTCGSGLFDFAYIEPFLISENRMRSKLNLSEQSQKAIEYLFNEMLLESERKKEGYKHFLKADLLKLLVLIGREYSNSNYDDYRDEKLLRKHKMAMLNAIRYMDENYSNDLKLSDVCKYSMMSQTYFSKFIKNLTGKTFTEYINNLRINNSLRLLNLDEKSITEICFEIGFNEVTHFNRVFKKIMGMTPSSYRKCY